MYLIILWFNSESIHKWWWWFMNCIMMPLRTNTIYFLGKFVRILTRWDSWWASIQMFKLKNIFKIFVFIHADKISVNWRTLCHWEQRMCVGYVESSPWMKKTEEAAHSDMSSCLHMLKVTWRTDENEVVVVGIFGVDIIFLWGCFVL